MTPNQLHDLVFQAWAPMKAAAADDMKIMEWGWGEAAAQAFTGVAPVDVDIESVGFHAATPLFDLVPRAAAAYLGTYLLSLLRSLEFQKSVGLFDDLVTRPHTLACLTNRSFWDRVIRKHLPAPCQEAMVQVAHFLAANRNALALRDEQVDILLELAAAARE